MLTAAVLLEKTNIDGIYIYSQDCLVKWMAFLQKNPQYTIIQYHTQLTRQLSTLNEEFTDYTKIFIFIESWFTLFIMYLLIQT